MHQSKLSHSVNRHRPRSQKSSCRKVHKKHVSTSHATRCVNKQKHAYFTTTTHTAEESTTKTEDTPKKPKTAVVMLNMGGPANPKDTFPFLQQLFNDDMIINLGRFQALGNYIAKRRAPKVQAQYELIGGSPIAKWTDIQGKQLTAQLDKLSPQTAPHKHYIAFRYADPTTQNALDEMKKDGITNAIAFSQYPQYSCTTAGSSFVDLWEKVKENKLENTIKWSIIDRWYDNPSLHHAIATNIFNAIETIPKDELQKTVILFSAHSIPVKIMDKGDQYPAEISSTVKSTMKSLYSLQKEKLSQIDDKIVELPHILCWQSKVGYLPWLGPSTSNTFVDLSSKGFTNAIIVPIAFTSDHIETLFEIDHEYRELAEKNGVKLIRAPSLNDSELLTKAQTEIVLEHLQSNKIINSPQYRVHCTNCVRPNECRTVLGYTKDELFANQRQD